MTDAMKRVVAEAILFYSTDATDGDLLRDDVQGIWDETPEWAKSALSVDDATEIAFAAIAPAVEQFKAALEQVAATFHKKEEPND